MKDKTRRKLKITVKQQEARKVVDNFIYENGFPPTYRDLLPLLNLKSSSVVYNRLRGYRHKMVKK
jgi:hypothetical protein